MKSRNDFGCQSEWLFYLQNDLGYNDLEICLSGKTKEGNIWFSKRYKLFNLMHLNPSDLISTDTQDKIKKPVWWFIQNATHRSILDIEIVCDIDDKEAYNSIKDKTIAIINLLKTHYPEEQFKVYFTGNKSYHIHIFIPELRDIPIRDELKKDFLEIIGADALKIGKNMIALEGAHHYKSGQPKEEVFI